MTKKLIEIKGEELVDKILSGERDFSNSCIKSGNLRESEKYGDLFQYLEKENSPHEPIMFDNSTISFLNVYKLGLEWLQAENVKFYNCKFVFATLLQANFQNSRFSDVSFASSYLVNSDFSNTVIKDTDFTNANLTYSKFSDAKIKSANFSKAVLRKAKLDFEAKGEIDFSYANLSQAIMGNIDSNYKGLEHANVKNTFVENLAEIINKKEGAKND